MWMWTVVTGADCWCTTCLLFCDFLNATDYYIEYDNTCWVSGKRCQGTIAFQLHGYLCISCIYLFLLCSFSVPGNASELFKNITASLVLYTELDYFWKHADQQKRDTAGFMCVTRWLPVDPAGGSFMVLGCLGAEYYE